MEADKPKKTGLLSNIGGAIKDTIPGIITGGLNTIAGAGINALVGGLSQVGAAKKQYKYGEMAAENAAKRQKEFYDYTYEKESPAAQKALYKAAGLNPALMYSNGAGSTSGSSQGGISGGGATAQGTSYADKLMGIQINGMMMKKQSAEIDLMQAQAEELRSKIPGNEGQPDMQESQKSLQKAQENYYNQLNNESKEKTKGQSIINDINNIEKQFQTDTYEIKVNTTKEQLNEIRKNIEEKEQSIALKAAQTYEAYSRGELNQAQAEAVIYGMQKTAAEISLMNYQEMLASQQLEKGEKELKLMDEKQKQEYINTAILRNQSKITEINANWARAEKWGNVFNGATAAMSNFTNTVIGAVGKGVIPLP